MFTKSALESEQEEDEKKKPDLEYCDGKAGCDEVCARVE